MNKNPSPATRFRPGQTGNAKGSSRKAQDRAEFTAALTKLLAEKGAAGKFLQAGWDAAVAGDFQFWRYLWERLEGKTVTPEPGPQICLEDIARAMKAKHDKLMLDRERSGEASQGEPPPPCGFRELPPPAPAPDPDREFLAAQAVERERQRRERVKHPEQAPAAAPPPPCGFRELDPPAAPEPEPSDRWYDHGGISIRID